MKKIITYLIIGIASMLFMINPVQASSSDLYLNQLDFQAEINQDGSMDVTEKWNIKIKDTNTLFKTFKTDKTKYSNITNVEVTEMTKGDNKPLKEQNRWSYHLPKGNYFGGLNDDKEFEIAWGVGLEDSSATRTYEISYQVEDAVAKYDDYAELYWQFVGKEFEVDAKKITGTILLPYDADSKEDIKVWGHTEDLNGEIYATDTDKIEFAINQFRSGRYVEVRTLFPTEMITYTGRGENTKRLEQVIQEETKWANQANERRKRKETIKLIATIVVNLVAIILTIFSIKSIIKNVKKIKTSKKLVPTQEIKYYREMPREDATPAEALAIFTKQIGGFNSSTHIGRIFSATLLDLNLKKIIDFQVNDKIITIKILENNPKELETLKDEKVIFEFLQEACKQKNGEITNKELEKYIKKSESKVISLKNKIDNNTEQALYEKELADKKGKDEKITIVACIIFLFIGLIFSTILFGILTATKDMNPIGMIPLFPVIIVQIIIFIILLSKTNVLTQKGTDENAEWKGLKKYMEDFSMLDKREVPEVVIWEKFLVYATVFGIADKVLKQLKIVYPNITEQLDTNTYGCMYLMMNTNFSSSFSNAISNSVSSAYSSASGGGGGFSGGGRRPDGGRRRRWRKIDEPY